MDTLRIDLETYSSLDLKKVGVYRYVEAKDFQIMLFGYRLNKEPRQVLDWTGVTRQQMLAYVAALDQDDMLLELLHPEVYAVFPPRVARALFDAAWRKKAFNANFERVCLMAWFSRPQPPEQWRCTMVHALYCGLPGDLARVGMVLRARIQKKPDGAALIRFFCMPCKPTKKNGQRTRNLPHHDPEKWARFVDYCGVDVDSEEVIDERLQKLPMPELEWKTWCMDQRINDRGVSVDIGMVRGAVRIGIDVKERLTRDAIALSGLSNPNSVSQLKNWLNEEAKDDLNTVVTTLNKKAMPGILLSLPEESVAWQMMKLREQMSKASVAKYQAMLNAVCADGRLRGMLQFYGANRTGRWAGRLVQIHNMIKNNYKLVPDPEVVRELIRTGDAQLLELLFGDAMVALSQMSRCAFAPTRPRYVLGPVDFSAIEARGLAWKAKEKWRLDVFRTHGKIYEASASKMFGIPIEQITKGSVYRDKGKVAELALGYGGGEGALVQMGALDMGIPLADLDPLKVTWRQANRCITQLWWDVGDAAMLCVRSGRSQEAHGIHFRIHCNCLLMRLESGRDLVYVRPKIEDGPYGDQITYEGMDQMTKQWVRISTYGPKLIENWDQAFCRDLLSHKMLTMEERGLGEYLSFHVHDEAVSEYEIGQSVLQQVEDIFSEPVPWAPGLPLRGDGYETPFYIKEKD